MSQVIWPAIHLRNCPIFISKKFSHYLLCIVYITRIWNDTISSNRNSLKVPYVILDLVLNHVSRKIPQIRDQYQDLCETNMQILNLNPVLYETNRPIIILILAHAWHKEECLLLGKPCHILQVQFGNLGYYVGFYRPTEKVPVCQAICVWVLLAWQNRVLVPGHLDYCLW